MHYKELKARLFGKKKKKDKKLKAKIFSMIPIYVYLFSYLC